MVALDKATGAVRWTFNDGKIHMVVACLRFTTQNGNAYIVVCEG